MALFNERSMVEIPFNESGRTEEGAFRRYAGMAELDAFTERSHAAEGTMGFSDIEMFVVQGQSTVFVEGRGNIIMTSGRDYRNRYVFKFDIEGDKIIKLREYYNPITSGLAFGRKIGPG
jgi:ketosteroid isomerase-like protein